MFVDFFIRRPVFATVCALLIILAGAVVVPSFLAASMATPWEVATFVSVSMSTKAGPEFADRPEANSIGRTSTSAWDW